MAALEGRVCSVYESLSNRAEGGVGGSAWSESAAEQSAGEIHK